MKLLCRIVDGLLVVHILPYKRKLVYYINAFLLMALKIVHHLVELYFLDVPCIARVIVIQALYWTFSILL